MHQLYIVGADVVQFKAEVNFDGREVARVHLNRLNLEEVLKVYHYRKDMAKASYHAIIIFCRRFRISEV